MSKIQTIAIKEKVLYMKRKLLQLYQDFTKTEKHVADYFIKYPEAIVNADINSIANEVGVSPATISRFVKKWFHCNLSEFKINWAKEISMSGQEQSTEIFTWGDDFSKVPEKIMLNIQQENQDVLNNNDMQLIEEVISLLVKAKRIQLFGVGSSGVAAMDFQQKLIKLGKQAIFLEDSNFGVLNATLLNEEDVALAFSFSGRTKDVNFAMEKAKERGAKTISITSTRKTKLEKNSDYYLYVPSTEYNDVRLAPIFSRYGQLFIVDILFVGMAQRLANSPTELLDRYQDVLKELREG